MKNHKSLFERIQAGEFDDSCFPEEQDPAELMFDQQIQTLHAYVEALERAKSAMPIRKPSPAHLQAELDRRERFRAALEEAFRMKGHAKADLLWNRAWCLGEFGGLEQVVFLYATLVELVK